MAYIELLEKLQSAVAPHVESAELRGQGSASFLFVQGKGRAVEASMSEGQWCLEFWEKDREDDAPSVKELWLHTDDEAEAEIIKRLR